MNEETQFNVTESDIEELIIEKRRNISDTNLKLVEEALIEGLTKHHTIFDETMDDATFFVNKQLREKMHGAWLVSLGPKGTSLCLDCRTSAILQLSFSKKNKEYDVVIAKIADDSKPVETPRKPGHKKRLSMCLLQMK